MRIFFVFVFASRSSQRHPLDYEGSAAFGWVTHALLREHYHPPILGSSGAPYTHFICFLNVFGNILFNSVEKPPKLRWKVS